MTERFTSPTPEEARRALAQADAASLATPGDRTRLERGLIVIGVAVAALVPALRLTVGNPGAPSGFRFGGLIAVMVVYVVVIVWAVFAMRRASAAPRGFSLRYNLGLGLTMALYAAYVIVSSARGDDAVSWLWVIVWAVFTMTPALLAAHSISKLALR